ncbi:MAG: hypothetical protein H6742_05210 [Alphaproteobacteria bacterium]|nr:hypothetical protein [Alphaproteobacteria bacterium]
MASLTQKTEYRRKLRNAKAGKERKAKLRNQGTTPSFPIHTPEADANAPSQAKGGSADE